MPMRGISAATVILSVVFATAISALVAATLPDLLRSADRGSTPASASTDRNHYPILEQRVADLEQRINSVLERLETQSSTDRNPAEMLARFVRLEMQLRSLNDRVASASTTSTSTPSSTTHDTGNSNVPNPQPPSPSALESEIRATLRKIEQERIIEAERQRQIQMAEWRKQREEWMDSQYNAYTDRLIRELGTTPAQLDAVKLLLAERKQNMMRLYDEDIPNDQKKSWDDYNNEFDTKMQTVLSAQQYQLYKQKRLDDFRTLNVQNDGNRRNNTNGNATRQNR